mmetsp:Transcript_23577/g.41715  ORF Transcript_23577/g.41715 Transcript_23577/m.41715 type:complete len:151 (-) Transcript_23577:327-779(-)
MTGMANAFAPRSFVSLLASLVLACAAFAAKAEADTVRLDWACTFEWRCGLDEDCEGITYLVDIVSDNAGQVYIRNAETLEQQPATEIKGTALFSYLAVQEDGAFEILSVFFSGYAVLSGHRFYPNSGNKGYGFGEQWYGNCGPSRIRDAD